MKDVSSFLISNLYSNLNHNECLEACFKESKEIKIICPYLTEKGVNWILKNKKTDQNVEIITELTKKAFVYGSQSLSALERLYSSECQLWYLSKNLHAKIFIFDNKKVLISSANMTQGGLFDNFEVGVLLEPSFINPNACSQAEFFQRIKDLYNNVKDSALKVTEEVLEILNSNSDLVPIRIDNQDDDLGIGYSTFSVRKTPCLNVDNIQTDLMPDSGFKSLKNEDWDVFDNSYGLDKIAVFRSELNERINPILRSFFNKLKRNPQIQSGLTNTVYGFSKNNLLTTRLPFDRYLYVTKDSVARKAHIGHPSIIFGMGKLKNRKYFEIRSGIEELNYSSITENGIYFLENIRNNIDSFMEAIGQLQNGWVLTHGRDGHELSVSVLTKSQVLDIVNSYLETKNISDLQVRRKFYLDDQSDREFLFSDGVIRNFAPEVNKLFSIFEIATLKR